MLTALLLPDERPVVARDCHRGMGTFRCKACGKEAILVKGDIRIHHFRHQPECSACSQERGESEEHRACKEEIYNALCSAEGVAEVELERRVGQNIADVYAVIRGFKVAIEVQRSTLSVDAIRQRTVEYHRTKVFVLWLSILREDACFDGYRPSAWERWCHAAYSGRVYYWVEKDLIQPVHFAPHRERVPRTTWAGAAGREYSAGGHERIVKAQRDPEHGQRARISQHFRPKMRSEWSSGTVNVPACSLFIDAQPVWWSQQERRMSLTHGDQSR